jgi:hypothetical protein
MDVRDSQVVCVRCEGSESRLGARRDPAHVACSRHPIITMQLQLQLHRQLQLHVFKGNHQI